MFKNFHPCSISRNAAARTRFRKRPEFGTSGSFLRDANAIHFGATPMAVHARPQRAD
jgi:hypothetical protein